MAKSGVSRRPKGRSPVIAVRVLLPLHEEIKASAAAAEHTMSEEMQQLLRSALENRKRFPSSTPPKPSKWRRSRSCSRANAMRKSTVLQTLVGRS